MLDELMKRHDFTPEEKEYCFPMAMRLLDLGKVVVVDGILGLEDATMTDNVFLQYGIRMVLNGKSLAHIESELAKKITTHEYTGEKLLESLLIAKGLLTICDMEFTPTKTVSVIAILMGDEYVAPLMAKIHEDFDHDEELTTEEQAALLAN